MYFNNPEFCGKPGVACPLVFTFPSCDIMLTACVKAFRLCGHRIYKSALYYLDGRYRLIIYPLDAPGHEESPSAAFLCEYAHPMGRGELLAAYVAEHGLPIAVENAIDKISYYLS